MRITYTRDHFQRSYIIQIVLDDEQLEGLPLSINLQPNMFLKLSTQLRLLATMAETLEAAQTEEDSNMADLTQDERDTETEEEELIEEEIQEEEEEPELEEEPEIEEELEELEEEELEEEEEAESESDPEEEEEEED